MSDVDESELSPVKDDDAAEEEAEEEAVEEAEDEAEEAAEEEAEEDAKDEEAEVATSVPSLPKIEQDDELNSESTEKVTNEDGSVTEYETYQTEGEYSTIISLEVASRLMEVTLNEDETFDKVEWRTLGKRERANTFRNILQHILPSCMDFRFQNSRVTVLNRDAVNRRGPKGRGPGRGKGKNFFLAVYTTGWCNYKEDHGCQTEFTVGFENQALINIAKKVESIDMGIIVKGNCRHKKDMPAQINHSARLSIDRPIVKAPGYIPNTDDRISSIQALQNKQSQLIMTMQSMMNSLVATQQQLDEDIEALRRSRHEEEENGKVVFASNSAAQQAGDDEVDAIIQSMTLERKWPVKWGIMEKFTTDKRLNKVRVHRSQKYQHIPVKIPVTNKNKLGKTSCKLCSTKEYHRATTWMCSVCQVPLCFLGHFERFHAARDLAEEERRVKREMALMNGSLKRKREEKKGEVDEGDGESGGAKKGRKMRASV